MPALKERRLKSPLGKQIHFPPIHSKHTEVMTDLGKVPSTGNREMNGATNLGAPRPGGTCQLQANKHFCSTY